MQRKKNKLYISTPEIRPATICQSKLYYLLIWTPEMTSYMQNSYGSTHETRWELIWIPEVRPASYLYP